MSMKVSKYDSLVRVIFMSEIDTLLDSIIHLQSKDSSQAHDAILTGHAEINQRRHFIVFIDIKFIT